MNKTKFPKFFQHSHEPEIIAQRLKKGIQHSYLKDFVYGAFDGLVTTFAVVSGVTGAQLDHRTIIILGFANLVADGFSMAASNYLGTRTQNQERELLEEYERSQVQQNPLGESHEVREIFIQQGQEGELLEKNIEFILKDKKRWVNFMLAEEYGHRGPPRSPFKAAGLTYLAFIIFGLTPLLAYIFHWNGPFLKATLMTTFGFFVIGLVKGIWTVGSIWISGFKTFLIGSLASALAYYVGQYFS